MATEAFQGHVARLPALQLMIPRANIAAHLLTSQSAACNRFHELIARAARWLLMVADRTGRSDLTLTQEFLSQMLGAYRPSVTVALRALVAARLVEVLRTRIVILDRTGLRDVACECYEASRRQTAQLLQLSGGVD